ncbi:MAG TPA: magnesium transporter, partial [Bdellovibrionota bacterium]|nr:magnesium transporter [Bdellovibrionota bacterium]
MEEDFDFDPSSVSALQAQWPELDIERRREYFFRLPRPDAEELFLSLSADQQMELAAFLLPNEIRSWVRLLELDDAADFIQQWPVEQRDRVLGLLDD